MSAALLAVAGAVLLWPDGRAVARYRLHRPGPPAGSRVPGRVPLPVVAAVAAGGAGALLATPLVAVLAAGCAALAARARLAGRRVAADVTRQAVLADALGAVAAELRAGRALAEAVRSAVADCPDAVVGAALVRAARAPAPGGDGGRDDGDGDGTPAALARLSAAVALGACTGCSLAAVVAAVEDDLRARLARRRELLVATAGPRAGARLLAGLPVLGLAMGSGVGADPWHVLTATATGQGLLVAGVLLEAAGVAWTGRLVRRIAR
ncbi:pilus assembly protein TadB [Blastococcus sp. MG754426]|uniref:type II secretion system F family protein n=1 Tax=unclassified Blastococcus TaxID=2619396 RepID=UPI001EF11A60|nr:MULTISPECIES: pilus assembly protein TadB [unclassified Blastococcus]MCF6506246.1 pilus assembly protein TadB [Blastococcus sp. MG754426]MCF6510376.1 pilus assembly protein TadB [Blastococcus sp. MG754427]